MDDGTRPRREPGHGSHFLAAVTGSDNSEYLLRWTDSAARRLGAAWTALHVLRPGQGGEDPGLRRNLDLARDLGAEVVSIVDSDVGSCIVRYARIKKASVLVIGKTDEGSQRARGRSNVAEDILRQSDELDVMILRGATPVRYRRPFLDPRGVSPRGMLIAAAALAAVTLLGLLGQPALGYRAVSILYLLAIIALPFACGRLVVFGAAVASAVLWNFLFIPPRLTFSIASLEDMLMFAAFFLAAFAGGFLTSRLKEKESALMQRERRMAFLYGFSRGVSRVRGLDGVARFGEAYLWDHLRLRAAVCLRDPGGALLEPAAETRPAGGEAPAGFDMGLARRCFAADECVAEGGERLYLPLGSQDSVLGVLFVAGEGERTMRGESRELLATLAGNLALAMEREHLSAENEANKMAGETARLSKILLNHVSHELRTPLTTIKGSVSGLLDGTTADDTRLRDALLSETLIAANKLNALVEDLLVMSRLEAGRLSPRKELAYISELLGAAQADMGDALEGRTVALSESARDAEIEADPALMVQVFRNVLRNFASYAGAGSTLTVSVESPPEGTAIRFADDGPGVPAAELPFLFDTFYRGSAGAATQGCGLGLSICRGIAEAHGGRAVAAPVPGGGLELDIILPGKERA